MATIKSGHSTRKLEDMLFWLCLGVGQAVLYRAIVTLELDISDTAKNVSEEDKRTWLVWPSIEHVRITWTCMQDGTIITLLAIALGHLVRYPVISYSPCLWNYLPFTLRQPHSGTSSSISYSPIPSAITSSSSDSPLCTSITPSRFHSRLKTYLFH